MQEIFSDSGELSNQADEILLNPFFKELLKYIPSTILILNRENQVIYANKDILEQAAKKTGSAKKGLRPGECLSCIRAAESINGCGTTSYCRFCGLANAIKDSWNDKEKSGECIISLQDGDTLTLNVNTKPFFHKEKRYVFCIIQDNSEKKYRQMLESIFLHDIRNTSAILSGLLEVYSELSDNEIHRIINDVSARINEEINTYKLISSAENKTLVVEPGQVNITELVNQTIYSLKINPRFSRKNIKFKENDHTIYTDKTLLRQVLINLIKNAFEAGPASDIIRIRYRHNDQPDRLIIEVQNNQVMSEDVKLNIFSKSFSTKGAGRGWGTFSIKLITERYLEGKVSCMSEKDYGTVFSINIPSLKKPAPENQMLAHC